MSSSHNNSTNKRTAWAVKEPTKIDDKYSDQRVSLSQDEFDKLLFQQGCRVKIYRTLYCPNVKSIDGAEHNIDCDMCNGSGLIDLHPLETTIVIQNQNLEKYQLIEGNVDGNTVVGTFPIGIELQYFTLVELVDHTDIFMERIKRSSGDIDVLKYTAKRVNVCIDQNNVEYYECIDFKLDPNGNIMWKNGRGPSPSTIYSVHYEAAVQFRAVRALHVNRFVQVKDDGDAGKVAFIKMPEQWFLKKEFLVKRVDQNGNEILPNPINDPDDD